MSSSNVSISATKKRNQNEKNQKNEKNEKNQKKEYDPLFDNPMVQQVRESMSAEDREKYDKIGKELYDSINFETGVPDETVNDVLEQLKAMIESGMHPSYLSYEEKNFLEHYMGKEWYTEFGYLKNDLNRINL